MVDGLFPTDAGGNPFLPVNPSLNAADFAGKDLAGIAALYNGAAGGAGFDIAWAIDGSNQGVSLPSIDYIRLDVLNDGTPAYIDAITVVPEPTTFALAITGVGFFVAPTHQIMRIIFILWGIGRRFGWRGGDHH